MSHVDCTVAPFFLSISPCYLHIEAVLLGCKVNRNLECLGTTAVLTIHRCSPPWLLNFAVVCSVTSSSSGMCVCGGGEAGSCLVSVSVDRPLHPFS